MGSVLSESELVQTVETLKSQGKRIVTTNGVFDILHAGHVKVLQQSRELGDLLIVGLNSDSSVRQIKGDKRPVYSQNDRAHLLCALACVDYVYIFNEKGSERFIEMVKPHIHTKAGDYTVEQVRAKEGSVVEKYGGQIRVLPFVPGYSSTKAIQLILEAYGAPR